MKLIRKTVNITVSLVFIFMIISLSACDRSCTRLCETFYYDLSKWSISDDTISKSLTFVNQTNDEFIFQHSNTIYSDHYNFSDLCGPEGLECRLSKTNFYHNELLDLEFGFEYLQYELADTSRNDICFRFNIKDESLDTFIQTGRLFFELERFKDEIDTIDQIGFNEIEYEDALIYEIDLMVNSRDNSLYPTRFVRKLYFKPPIGVVQIELENGQILLRKN